MTVSHYLDDDELWDIYASRGMTPNTVTTSHDIETRAHWIQEIKEELKGRRYKL